MSTESTSLLHGLPLNSSSRMSQADKNSGVIIIIISQIAFIIVSMPVISQHRPDRLYYAFWVTT